MRITNRIIIKLYSPDNKKLLRKLIIKAPAGATFTPIGVQVQIEHLKTRLDTALPGHHYKCFPKNKEEFRFYWDNKFKLTPEELKDFYTGYNNLDSTPKDAELEPECPSTPTDSEPASTV